MGMNKKEFSIKQILGCAVLLYWMLVGLFYFAAGDGLYQGAASSAMVSPKDILPTVKQADVLSQKFLCETDTVERIVLYGMTYGRSNTDIIEVAIKDETDAVLAVQQLNTAEITASGNWEMVFPSPIQNTDDRLLTLQITSVRGREDDGVTFYYGDSVSTSRMDMKISIQEDMVLHVNGQPTSGKLCFSVVGTNYYKTGQYYWPVACVLGLGLGMYALYTVRSIGRRDTLCLRLIVVFKKYRFLIKQLVNRDFKTKYKRSVLGVFWSFLNPLLTMMVQYLVFSTLFKSDIANFPVYLLTGIITFSYFGEVTSMCLTSIIGNAGLITKVYVPKYIYPLSRALSSTTNFMFSLIPLAIVMLLTRTPITKSVLLVPFVIFCAFMFSLGIGLILSSLMVFFRDTQFLWGVISMIWMYATPIFYPETIIPDRLMTLFKMNPMYHIIRAFRIILIDGISPEPRAYLFCLIAAVVPFIVGVCVFKKSQDKFIFYI